mmetsp:Transcript_34816/g.86366  ORF Transcript_34816/g.86366 Transcript_34816/m.86366 type:complete len:712 (+) Transcript_34816:295-2430(+)
MRRRKEEVSIEERLRLVEQFNQRKQSGEKITADDFAREKRLPPYLFANWLRGAKRQEEKQREGGMPFIDPTKKRHTPPKYQQIENEMRQWMATHDNPTSVPTEDIRAMAMEIASRLDIIGFKGTKSWVKAFRKRCQQNPPGPSASPASSLADTTNDMQGPLPSSEPPVAAASTDGNTESPPVPPRKGDSVSDQQSQVVDESAALREADGFIGRNNDLSRQTTIWPPDDDAAAASDRPLDQQSQPSEHDTMGKAPSESRLTNERPPNKIRRSDTRSCREGLPSELWSGNSVKSAVTPTADGRLSDIPEENDGGDMLSVSDDASTHVTAVSTHSATSGDDRSPDPQVIVGSSMSPAECKGLYSLFVPSIFDQCSFTLLYRASANGEDYVDVLRCVGNASPLVIVIRNGHHCFGIYIKDGIKLHRDPSQANLYTCDVWRFSFANHLGRIRIIKQGREFVFAAGREPQRAVKEGVDGAAKLMVGWRDGLCLGWSEHDRCASIRSCRQIIQARRSDSILADELEIIGVDGISFPPPQTIEGSKLCALESAALTCCLRVPESGSRKLLYRASRDGGRFGDLLRCVGGASGLAIVIRKDRFVFGAYINDGVRLPDGPTQSSRFGCYVQHFSLSGHFDNPTTIYEGCQSVRLAGRDAALILKIGLAGGLFVGCGVHDNALDADVRSCRHFVDGCDAPVGYKGVKDTQPGWLFFWWQRRV